MIRGYPGNRYKEGESSRESKLRPAWATEMRLYLRREKLGLFLEKPRREVPVIEETTPPEQATIFHSRSLGQECFKILSVWI